MFWIFKIFPDWFWPAIVLLGIIWFAVSYLPQVAHLSKPSKILASMVVVLGIFVNGMFYADKTWKQATAELEAKVAAAEIKSAATNEVIKERVVNKLQIVKVRGEEITKYIQQDVSKTNDQCAVSKEFVTAHNRATEQPK